MKPLVYKGLRKNLNRSVKILFTWIIGRKKQRYVTEEN